MRCINHDHKHIHRRAFVNTIFELEILWSSRDSTPKIQRSKGSAKREENRKKIQFVDRELALTASRRATATAAQLAA